MVTAGDSAPGACTSPTQISGPRQRRLELVGQIAVGRGGLVGDVEHGVVERIVHARVLREGD